MRGSDRAMTVVLAAALALAGCAPAPPGRAEGGRHPPCLTNLPAPRHAPSTIGMAFIRRGAFQMGAKPMRPEEGPPRLTRVGSFWIDRTDVTNAQFARFVAATGYVTLAEKPLDPKAYPGLSSGQLKPSAIVFVGSDRPAGSDPSQWWRVESGADWRHPKGPGSSIEGQETLPVVQIGWDDAVAYAHWLGRDLPTEAEWEFAAQGGKGATRFVWGDAPIDSAHPQANVWQGVFPALDTGADGFKAEASPVGCFPANGYGLYDMAGDVWQWTRDWFRPNLDPGDPGDPGARKHVIKGGSFLCSPNYCYRYRPAAREAGPADTGENHIGFRTVLRIEGGRVNQASGLPRFHDHPTMPAKFPQS